MSDPVCTVSGPEGTEVEVPIVWDPACEAVAFQCDLLTDARVDLLLEPKGGWELMAYQHSPTRWRVLAVDFQDTTRRLDDVGTITFALLEDVDDDEPIVVEISPNHLALAVDLTTTKAFRVEVRDGRFYAV